MPELALVWTALLGLSLGSIFPLFLAFTVERASDPDTAGSLSGFMLFVGYLIAALGPLGLGAAPDLTGGFDSTFPILLVVAGLLVASALALDHEHEDLETPHLPP